MNIKSNLRLKHSLYVDFDGFSCHLRNVRIFNINTNYLG
jgi:hypothetical protein